MVYFLPSFEPDKRAINAYNHHCSPCVSVLFLKLDAQSLMLKGGSLKGGSLRVCLIVNPNLRNSENGRLRRDGDTVPNQTQSSSKQQVSDLSWRIR